MFFVQITPNNASKRVTNECRRDFSDLQNDL